MEKSAVFENDLVLKCFEAIRILKDLTFGKYIVNTEKSNLRKRSVVGSLEKRSKMAHKRLLKGIEDLNKCKSDRIARLICRHKFNRDETIAFLALCDDLIRGYGMLNIGDLSRLLAKQNPVVFFEKLKIFKTSQRLIKSGLVSILTNPEMPAIFPGWQCIYLTPKGINSIIGVRKQREVKPNNSIQVLQGNNSFTAETLKSPKNLFEELSKYIIGQDTAKKILSTAVYNHYKKLEKLNKGNVSEGKSNILLRSFSANLTSKAT